MKQIAKTQLIPIALTVVVFAFLCAVLYFCIVILNTFSKTDIVMQIRWADVLVGLTIYLKTSVDFAILIGNLMANYHGTRNRIAIEVGTAFGNALGTIIVLIIWNFFRDIEWLLAIMITVAAFVLFRLAQDGLEHAKEGNISLSPWLQTLLNKYESILLATNRALNPILSRIVPHVSMKPIKNLSLYRLFAASFTIPFILGLDDFAGYVPLFSIVNVFGFAVGVFLGHMVLNMALFIAPSKTIKAVKNPVISLAGSIVFVGLGLWGLVEVYKILFIH